MSNAHATIVVGAVNRTQQTFNQINHNVKGLSKEINGGLKEAIAGVFAAEAVKEMIVSTIDWADSISKASDRLGVGVENVEALELAAKKAGKAFDSVEQSMNKLDVAAAKALGGSAKQLEAFSKLGINQDQLKHLNRTDLLSKVAQGTQGMSTAQATAFLSPIVGQGNVGTVLGMQGNLANFGAFKDKEKQSGGIASAEDIQALSELKDKFEEISQAAKAEFVPVLTTALDWIYKFGRGVKQLVELVGTELGAFFGSIEKFDLKGLIISYGQAIVDGWKNVFDNVVAIITGKKTIGEAFGDVASKTMESTGKIMNATFGDKFTDTFGQVVQDKLVEMAQDDQRLAEDEARRKKELADKEKDKDKNPNRQAAAGSEKKEVKLEALKGDDSLLKNGNLIGKDTLYRMERIALSQLDALRQIVKNTTPSAIDNDYGDDDATTR